MLHKQIRADAGDNSQPVRDALEHPASLPDSVCVCIPSTVHTVHRLRREDNDLWGIRTHRSRCLAKQFANRSKRREIQKLPRPTCRCLVFITLLFAHLAVWRLKVARLKLLEFRVHQKENLFASSVNLQRIRECDRPLCAPNRQIFKFNDAA